MELPQSFPYAPRNCAHYFPPAAEKPAMARWYECRWLLPRRAFTLALLPRRSCPPTEPVSNTADHSRWRTMRRFTTSTRHRYVIVAMQRKAKYVGGGTVNPS